MDQPAIKNGKRTGIGKGRPPVETRFARGNPGRAPGRRNRASVVAEALADGEATEIVKAVIKKAKRGDMVAARIIIDRLWPSPKGRTVEFTLPEVTDANGIVRAHGSLLQGITAGLLTPDEAETVSRLLAVHLRAIEANEIERRLAALEASSHAS
jgi:hypothetical protein